MSSELEAVEGLAWPIEVRAHPRARAVRLRMDEGRSRFVLTHPRRMSRRAALDWARKQREWAEHQLASVSPAIPFEPNALIPIEGTTREIRWSELYARQPQLAGAVLHCGGPLSSLSGRIERFLRSLARQRLSERTAVMAARAGVQVKSVSVADTRSRWGSCSASGSIRYSWRLILAPPPVLDWVVAHEVAHRRHMNHGQEFRALEAELFDGDVSATRAQLRALGPGLKRVGRPL